MAPVLAHIAAFLFDHRENLWNGACAAAGGALSVHISMPRRVRRLMRKYVAHHEAEFHAAELGGVSCLVDAGGKAGATG
jgi:hypothetical protein